MEGATNASDGTKECISGFTFVVLTASETPENKARWDHLAESLAELLFELWQDQLKRTDGPT